MISDSAPMPPVTAERYGQLSDADLLLLLRGGWILDAEPDDFSVLARSFSRFVMTNGYWLMAAAEKGIEAEPREARGLP